MRKIIILPFPDSKLMPNNANGKHWGYNSAQKKKAKNDTYYISLEAGLKGANVGGSLLFRFFAKDSRKRDVDNLIAAMKSAVDGLALGIGIDDSHFTDQKGINGIDRKHPRVEITLELNK